MILAEQGEIIMDGRKNNGGTPPNRKGILHSETTKIKISEGIKNHLPSTAFKKSHIVSEEHKKILSERMKGNQYTSGRKWSEEERKNRIILSGENHPSWKGGITAFNRYLRNNSLMKIWREAVFLRDNFTCQNSNCEYCHNQIGVFLNAHHKKPLSLFPELAFVIDNGITYCEEFHLKSELHKNMEKENVIL